MNRVIFSAGRPVAVAIVFLCLLALTLCKILGPTARLNHAFAPADLAVPALVASSEHFSGSYNPLPSRCAAIKLAPLEIKSMDFAPAMATCEMAAAVTSTPPHSAELGVPTPPPRQA
jgi:hypothetical protein